MYLVPEFLFSMIELCHQPSVLLSWMLEFLLWFNDYSFEFEVCSLSVTDSMIQLRLSTSAVLPSNLGRLLPIDCAFPSSSFTKLTTFVCEFFDLVHFFCLSCLLFIPCLCFTFIFLFFSFFLGLFCMAVTFVALWWWILILDWLCFWGSVFGGLTPQNPKVYNSMSQMFKDTTACTCSFFFC